MTQTDIDEIIRNYRNEQTLKGLAEAERGEGVTIEETKALLDIQTKLAEAEQDVAASDVVSGEEDLQKLIARYEEAQDPLNEQEAFDARTWQGLAEAERGEGISMEEVRANMEKLIAKANQK